MQHGFPGLNKSWLCRRATSPGITRGAHQDDVPEVSGAANWHLTTPLQTHIGLTDPHVLKARAQRA